MFLFGFVDVVFLFLSQYLLCLYISVEVMPQYQIMNSIEPTSFDVSYMTGSDCSNSNKNIDEMGKKCAERQIEWRIMEIVHILMTLHLSFLSFHCRCWLFTITFFCSYTALLFGFSGPDFFLQSTVAVVVYNIVFIAWKKRTFQFQTVFFCRCQLI